LSLKQICSFADRILNDFTTANYEKEKEKKVGWGADKSLTRLTSDVVGRNRCRWKEGSVRMPNCKTFLVTEAERKHVRRRERFQQHRDASCHQVEDKNKPTKCTN